MSRLFGEALRCDQRALDVAQCHQDGLLVDVYELILARFRKIQLSLQSPIVEDGRDQSGSEAVDEIPAAQQC
jgi:hypothetical protein